MAYKIVTTKRFDKTYKKLSAADRDLVDFVVDQISQGQKLDAKYKDHPLKGNLKSFRDCHVKPDLVLVYSINEEYLVLTAFNLGSHSEVFK